MWAQIVVSIGTRQRNLNCRQSRMHCGLSSRVTIFKIHYFQNKISSSTYRIEWREHSCQSATGCQDGRMDGLRYIWRSLGTLGSLLWIWVWKGGLSSVSSDYFLHYRTFLLEIERKNGGRGGRRQKKSSCCIFLLIGNLDKCELICTIVFPFSINWILPSSCLCLRCDKPQITAGS